MLRRARCEKRVTWVMNIMGLRVAAMDTVQLGTARYGLSNYAWTTKNWGMSSDFSVVLGLREDNEENYHWDTGMELLPGEIPMLASAEPIVNLTDVQLSIANSFQIGEPITAYDDGRIVIADHVRRYLSPPRDVQVKGTTINTGLAAGQQRYIGYDDEELDGGVVAYVLAADGYASLISPDHPYRHYLGVATIPTAGSPPSTGGGGTPPGGGGGGMCVVEGTPILMAPGEEEPAGEALLGRRIYTRHEVTLEWGMYPVEAVEVVDSDDVWSATIGGRALEATGGHLVYTGTWQPMRDLPGAAKVEGGRRVVRMTVTGAHTYVSNGILSHNLKPDRVAE